MHLGLNKRIIKHNYLHKPRDSWMHAAFSPRHRVGATCISHATLGCTLPFAAAPRHRLKHNFLHKRDTQVY